MRAVGGAHRWEPVEADRLASVRQLVEAAQNGSPELARLLKRSFPLLESLSVDAADLFTSSTLSPSTSSREHTRPPVPGTTSFSALTANTAVWQDQALVVLSSRKRPQVRVGTDSPEPMTQVPETPYWIHLCRIAPGAIQSFTYLIDGRELAVGDLAGYLPDSYDRPGVAAGASLTVTRLRVTFTQVRRPATASTATPASTLTGGRR